MKYVRYAEVQSVLIIIVFFFFFFTYSLLIDYNETLTTTCVNEWEKKAGHLEQNARW
jgi:uncharacterized membrane protein (DUF485 family)